MFRVGQKVVCVKEGRWSDEGEGPETYPHYGDILTIRTIGVNAQGRVMLRFHEINNPLRKYREGVSECRFWAARFRPVVDISDLQALVAETLRGKPRRIAADQFDRKRVGA